MVHLRVVRKAIKRGESTVGDEQVGALLLERQNDPDEQAIDRGIGRAGQSDVELPVVQSSQLFGQHHLFPHSALQHRMW